MDILDPFGNGERRQQIEYMRELEEQAHSDRVFVFSDVILTNSKTCDNLKMTFEAYEKLPGNYLFILIGPFTSKEFTSTGGRDEADRAFEFFGNTLENCPRLSKEAKFLFVPAMNDPGPQAAYPKKSLLEKLVENLRKRIQSISIGTNPCHLRFYTQEITIFRDDLLRRMMRHVLPKVPPSKDDDAMDLREQLLHSVIEQGHLFPLPDVPNT